MKHIIDQVIDRRNQLNIDQNTIQLSSVLIRRLITELNKYMVGNKQIKFDSEMYEFQYCSIDGKVYTIRNRNYRDDTNDSDVEEIMCDFIEAI